MRVGGARVGFKRVGRVDWFLHHELNDQLTLPECACWFVDAYIPRASFRHAGGCGLRDVAPFAPQWSVRVRV